jgi:hypothetical protein
MVSTVMIGKINVSDDLAIIAKFPTLSVCLSIPPTGS